jgi:hypothetical protein
MGYLTEMNGMSTLSNPSLTLVDGWMQSTGHRMNLLSYEHVAGSVACYGGYCVFLGLNHSSFGEGCYTAAEGQAYAKRFESCTQEQMRQYDILNQEQQLLMSKQERCMMSKNERRTDFGIAQFRKSCVKYNYLKVYHKTGEEL